MQRSYAVTSLTKAGLIIAAIMVFVAGAAFCQNDPGTRVPMSIEGFSDDITTALEDYSYFYDIALSPDGQWIAFQANHEHSEIWIVPSAGGEQRLLYQVTPDEQGVNPYIRNITFSSTSREVLFTLMYYDESRGSEYYMTGVREPTMYARFGLHDIMGIDITTGETRVVREGARSFALSDDGRFLAYENHDYRFYIDGMEPDYNGVITILDLQTENSWYLTDEAISTYQFANPDDPDEGDLTGLLYHVKTISADNSYVYYRRYDYDTRERGIYRIPLTGGDPEPVVANTSSSITNGRFSPDMRWMLCREPSDVRYSFSGDGSTYSGTYSVLYVYDTENHTKYPLLQPVEDEPYINPADYCWSKDGSHFYYVGDNKNLAFEYRQTYGLGGMNHCELYILAFDPETLIPTAVETDAPAVFPTIANSPNPFNPVTTISFVLPEAGYAELAVYNLAGQKVRILATGEYAPGTHVIVWDGCNSSGEALSSGVYFSRLDSGNAFVTHRMTLVK